jgi:elongation factor Ts
VATEGEVRASVAPDKRSATIIEVNIQTDFAARNDLFRQFVGDVLALAEKAEAGSDLGDQQISGQEGDGRGERAHARVSARRWPFGAGSGCPWPEGKSGLAHAYVHLGGKIGVALVVETDSDAVASHAEVVKFVDDTAMQIAAMAATSLRREDVAEDLVSKQRDIFETQMRDDPKPKPQAAWPKIIEGKLNKWYSEIVLLEQESVVVPGHTIEKLREAAAKAAGGTVTLTRFVRFERGEGLSKGEKDDFAAEVAKMAGG